MVQPAIERQSRQEHTHSPDLTTHPSVKVITLTAIALQFREHAYQCKGSAVASMRTADHPRCRHSLRIQRCSPVSTVCQSPAASMGACQHGTVHVDCTTASFFPFLSFPLAHCTRCYFLRFCVGPFPFHIHYLTVKLPSFNAFVIV